MSLLRSERCLLLVVDPQERLLPAIVGRERIVHNTLLLLKLAQLSGIPVLATTQYRKGLGPIVPELAQALGGEAIDKTSFGCFQSDDFMRALGAFGQRDQLLVSGIETHICICQTVLGGLEKGYTVHVASDAVGSRSAENHGVGLARMERGGALLSSTEMAIYELLGRADSEIFKQMLPLLKA